MLFASPLQFVSLLLRSSVTRKNRQMSTKVAQKDFTRKIKDFGTFTKLPKNVGDLGKIIFATGFECMGKRQKNRRIWSYCFLP